MEIVVNGESETIQPCTIAELVAQKNLTPGSLVVELNQQIIKQQQWSQTQLVQGDHLELLSFVGGG